MPFHLAQVAFYTELGRYTDSFEVLGFDLEGGTQVNESTIDGKAYRFEIGTFDYEGEPDGRFWATATADLDRGDAVMDVLLIENDLVIKE